MRWRRIFAKGKGSEKRAPKVLPPEGRVLGTDVSAGALSKGLAHLSISGKSACLEGKYERESSASGAGR